MTEISEKNTKAEILVAYSELVAELDLLKQQSEAKEASGDQCSSEQQTVGASTIADLEAEIERLKSAGSIPALIETNNRITVVIPFVAALAQGNELQLALRGWERNFREDFNVVIIGDRAPWMDDNIIDVIECECVGNNPPIDIAHKMLMAIESDLVTEKFIWANDDQYLISPCMLADFETLKCTGKLGEKSFGGQLYQQNKKRTFDTLKENGLGTWDFSSHIPVVFEKQKLKECIEFFNLTETPMLITTLYFNSWFLGYVPLRIDTQSSLENDNIKIGVYRENADMDKLKQLMPSKKLISNSESGWSNKFSAIINDIFKEKCRFEK